MCITLTAAYADAVERTREALADQGFGILTEIDVAATMKAKLDVDMAPHLILGACNPPLAHEALGIEASIGLLLPCNVVVRSIDDKHTLVEAMNPAVMVSATGNSALSGVAEQAGTRLSAALAALSTGTKPPA
ncbi:MAG: DUF302 domain-containing protein [Pseudonocardiales bacterium]